MIYKVRICDGNIIDYRVEAIPSTYEYITMLNGFVKVDSKDQDWSEGHLTVRNISEIYVDTEYNFDLDDKQIIDLVNKIKGFERDRKLSSLLK